MSINIISFNKNKKITDILKKMAIIQKNKGETYRYQAYINAIRALKKINYKITSGSQAQELYGIGTKIATRINEILKTGTLKELKDYEKNPKIIAIKQLTRIIGIGPVKAKKLIDEFNIYSIKDLIQSHKKNKIKLNREQLIGIKYYKDISKKIPRSKVTKIFNIIKKYILFINKQFKIIPAGSYRRKKKESSDVDILITHPTIKTKNDVLKNNILNNIIHILKEKKYILEIISLKHTKFMGIFRLKGTKKYIARRIDIIFIPYESYHTALLYFTGSREFNKQMRTIALENNMKLNEWGLYKKNSQNKKIKKLSVSSEKDVFNYLNIPYLPPEKR